MEDHQVAGTSSNSGPVTNDDEVAAKLKKTKKRILPMVNNDEEKSKKKHVGKRRRNDDTAADIIAKNEFDVHAAQFLGTLHHNLAKCLFEQPRSSSARLTPIDCTLRQFVTSAKRLEWRIFWRDAYGIMCKTMHFFDGPLNKRHITDKINGLFRPAYLATITRAIKEHHNVSSNMLSPAYYIGIDDEYRNFMNRSSFDENSRVYKLMWSQMSDIATTFIDVVWDAIERHVSDPTIDYQQLCEYLQMMYETAMLGGHVLLAVPLSQFASLRVVQIMNKIRLHELIRSVQQNHGYGLVYNTVVVITLVAAMNYTVLLRGLRPAQLWPFSDSRWPEFIRNNAAIISYHFLSGLTGERLLLVNGDNRRSGVSWRSEEYVAEIKLKSAAIIASGIHDEYVNVNEMNLIALSEYLDLIASPVAYLDGLCLLSRHIKLDQRCYSCGNYMCTVLDPHSDHEELDEPTNHPEPAENLALQCNVISSTVSVVESFPKIPSCPLWDIVNSDHYGLEEKNALVNLNFVNLAILREYAHSNSHDAILDYQVFGLRSFPYNYHLNAHLNVSRHLFVSHTSRLVTYPLPVSLSSVNE